MARSSSVTMSASTGDSVGNLQLDPGRHRLRGRQPTPPRTLGHRRHRTTSRGTGKSRLDRRIHPGGIASRGQRPARRDIVFHNLLPDGGKSGLLQNVASYAALAANTRLVLFDGKLVELGPYMDIADEFVGPNIEHGLSVMRRLLVVATNRYLWLLSHIPSRRKIDRSDGLSVI